MSEPVELRGHCDERFEPVRAAFQKNLDEGLELGARFVLEIDGEVAVDLMAGFADRGRTRLFDEQTLTPIFSTTKAVTSVMVARAVEQGKLAYDQRVTEVWPEFGQAGKDAVTVEQVLSHQAGLCGLVEPMDPETWFDWDAICARLAAMAPLWPVGTASGYHPVTFGYLAGEIFRRADGRTVGQALREDLAGPLGLDIWISTPDSEVPRIAEMERPKGLPDFGTINEYRKAAFFTPWSQPSGRGGGAWRRAEIPSANGHATAASLARLMGALARDGSVSGVHVLSPETVRLAARERIEGDDLVLPYHMAWGAGFMRNDGLWIYGNGDLTFGHSGWGGSCVFADPDRRISGAYVMNRQSAALLGDPRPVRLIEAAFRAL